MATSAVSIPTVEELQGQLAEAQKTIREKDGLIRKLTRALRILRENFYGPNEKTVLNELISEGELGVE